MRIAVMGALTALALSACGQPGFAASGSAGIPSPRRLPSLASRPRPPPQRRTLLGSPPAQFPSCPRILSLSLRPPAPSANPEARRLPATSLATVASTSRTLSIFCSGSRSAPTTGTDALLESLSCLTTGEGSLCLRLLDIAPAPQNCLLIASMPRMAFGGELLTQVPSIGVFRSTPTFPAQTLRWRMSPASFFRVDGE